MKLLAFLLALSTQAHADELLKCQGKMEDSWTTLEFHYVENNNGAAFLWKEFSDDALSMNCQTVSEGNVFWACEEAVKIGNSFLRANVEHTPHGDWASVYREEKGQGSTLLATLDCR